MIYEGTRIDRVDDDGVDPRIDDDSDDDDYDEDEMKTLEKEIEISLDDVFPPTDFSTRPSEATLDERVMSFAARATSFAATATLFAATARP